VVHVIDILRNLQVLKGAAVVHQRDSGALSSSRAAMQAVGPALLLSPMPVATCTLSTSLPQFNGCRRPQLGADVYVVEYGAVTAMTVPLLPPRPRVPLLSLQTDAHIVHTCTVMYRLTFGLLHVSGIAV
jgi:hypothetical protein